jgi:hypothetical protein
MNGQSVEDLVRCLLVAFAWPSELKSDIEAVIRCIADGRFGFLDTEPDRPSWVDCGRPGFGSRLL